MPTASNNKLNYAKSAKNDEFYTRFQDIEHELFAYYGHNRDVFRDKTILLPCDDPEWSNFTKLLAANFDEFGIRKLFSTSYSRIGKGRVYTLVSGNPSVPRTTIDSLAVTELAGNGDFRSDEVRALRDESDIIITNPPFSLFRDFLSWITEANKSFLILGNKTAASYKQVFPLILSKMLWSGHTRWSAAMWFNLPDTAVDYDRIIKINGRHIKQKCVPSVWYTNLDHGRRHEPLRLLTMKNLRNYNPRQVEEGAFASYDNYDAIHVPRVNMIPSDYPGVMGVPITFLDKYCPEQFELLGITDNSDSSSVRSLRISGSSKYDRPYLDGRRLFPRLLIAHRQCG